MFFNLINKSNQIQIEGCIVLYVSKHIVEVEMKCITLVYVYLWRIIHQDPLFRLLFVEMTDEGVDVGVLCVLPVLPTSSFD